MVKKYLITGITGFVGKHLSNLLAEEGHTIFGAVRTPGHEELMKDVVSKKTLDNIHFLSSDLTDRALTEKLFKEQEFDGVFHFAAQSNVDLSFKQPLQTYITNTIGTLNIVDSVCRYQPNTSLVFASSGEVYGICDPKKGKITEDFYLNPATPYGVSKAAAELIVKERANSLKKRFMIGRGFSSTGPGRPRNFAISSDAAQIAEIKAGKRDPIINVGDLEKQRAVMDVRDCVKAYYLIMEKGEGGEVYNVAGEEVKRIGDFLDQMLEISDLNNKVEIKKDPSLLRLVDIPIQMPSSAKVREKLGWRQKIPLEQTLKDLLVYWDVKIEE